MTLPFDLIHRVHGRRRVLRQLATILAAVSARTGRILEFLTHSGCCFSETSQLKIAKATTARRNPLATPNTKPQRPVEGADLAVEDQVRQSNREQRHNDQA